MFWKGSKLSSLFLYLIKKWHNEKMQNHNRGTQTEVWSEDTAVASLNNQHITKKDLHPPLMQTQQPYSHSESLLPLWAVCVVALLSSLWLAIDRYFNIGTWTKPVFFVFFKFGWKNYNKKIQIILQEILENFNSSSAAIEIKFQFNYSI